METAPIYTSTVQVQHYGNLWIMFYRHGMNANLSKSFYCNGTLVDAQKRAREHCRIMGYKFIFVRPLVCNLDQEEEYQLKGGTPGELTP